ncbi:putative LPS assembly protein LptD, partial [Roseisolibacter sp. H3M3-2]|uniref:putative LPS assembly protein LptD n=1 Tax=Roseisolibacter sp. H3M3-2 TaxID=3031323 RepID=UPI0023DA7CFA
RVSARPRAVQAALAAAAPLSAQPRLPGLPGVPGGAGGRGAGARPGEAARPDSALVKFLQPDSTMAALLERPGFTATRYQGDTVRFRAGDRTLSLEGRPAAVQRDQTLLVGSAVEYNDSTQIIVARPDSVRGDTVFLRDPNQADVAVRGRIVYYLAERRGTIEQFQTSVTSGETWFVAGERGALVSDSIVEGKRYVFARDGSVTSCNETVPHYHFQARDIKMVTRNLLVVRPAVLYIADVPVMWLPFVFQDMRSGRRSGLLTPRFGVAELIRNSPSYRRSLENLGYYFNLGDFADASAWLDWRSGSRGDGFDPGWIRGNAEARYRVIDRFLQGRLSASYTANRTGDRNLAISLGHEQSFNQQRRLSANLNYVQNTTVQRQNSINPAAVLGTIASQLNFQDRFGPMSFSIGGSRKQYPGRDQVDQDFPNVNLTSRTIEVGENFAWTPTLSLSNSQNFRIDQGQQFNVLLRPNASGRIDSVAVNAARRSTQLRVESPLKIFDFNWTNSFSFSETVEDFPQTRTVFRDPRDTTSRETRVFRQTFQSNLDWNTSFNLPRFLQGTWNVSPTVSLSNVESDRGAGLFVRSEQSGGRWVAQRKRASFGLSASPTFYAFPPGFGRVERFRHSINPVISFSYSPTAKVSDEFLAALGRASQGYLGSLMQSRVSLQLSSNLEAKLRGRRPSEPASGQPTTTAPGDSAGAPADSLGGVGDTTRTPLRTDAGGSAVAEGTKVRLLSLNFTPLSFDFVRADSLGKSLFSKRGFTDQTFGISARSDLIPGLDFNTRYSLFLGDPVTDTAVFKPYRTETGVTFSLDQNSPIFGTIARLFGRRTQPTSTTGTQTPTQGRPGTAAGGDAFFSRQAVAQQVAGQGARNAQFDVPTGQGWQASVSYTSSRQRPDIVGGTVAADPTVQCRAFVNQPTYVYERCLINAQANPQPGTPLGQTTYGGPVFLTPPQQSLTLNTSFPITQKWAAQWSTTYDAQRGGFASNQVTLQRELHDWRAVFAFTQSPNGNFGFNFFVALKAQPDLKFDYNRQTFRDPSGSASFP